MTIMRGADLVTIERIRRAFKTKLGVEIPRSRRWDMEILDTYDKYNHTNLTSKELDNAIADDLYFKLEHKRDEDRDI